MQELFNYVAVALIVAVSNLLIVYIFIQRENKQLQAQKAIVSKKESLSLVLTAHERLVLLLERINPERIIEASTRQGMSAIQLHQLLIANTNKEFDHNLTQQLYVSEEAWEKVVRAKEEMIALYNISMKSVPSNSPAPDLGQTILRTFGNIDGTPLEVALLALKKDASAMMGNTH